MRCTGRSIGIHEADCFRSPAHGVVDKGAVHSHNPLYEWLQNGFLVRRGPVFASVAILNRVPDSGENLEHS